LRAGHLDGGDPIDLNEDTDPNGQDLRHLHDLFQAEVSFTASIGAATKIGIFSSAPDLVESERARVIVH